MPLSAEWSRPGTAETAAVGPVEIQLATVFRRCKRNASATSTAEPFRDVDAADSSRSCPPAVLERPHAGTTGPACGTPALRQSRRPPPRRTLRDALMTDIPRARQLPVEPEWFKRAVFYEMFVQACYDSTGDGYGDFAGMTSKLD